MTDAPTTARPRDAMDDLLIDLRHPLRVMVDALPRRGAAGFASAGDGLASAPALRSRHTVSVVIPAMNEAENLHFILPLLPPCVDEAILVDGNSRDDTIGVARRARPGIRIVRQAGRGKGDALTHGFAVATGDIIVMLDADGSADPGEIPRLIDALERGADYAKGTRFAPGGGSQDITRLRRLGNRGFTVLVNVLFGTRYTDLCYGLNAFRSSCLAQLDIECDGFEVETLMNVRAACAGLRVAEVPSFEHDRISGSSNLRAVRDGLRVLRTILREFARPRFQTDDATTGVREGSSSRELVA